MSVVPNSLLLPLDTVLVVVQATSGSFLFRIVLERCAHYLVHSILVLLAGYIEKNAFLPSESKVYL